MSEKKTSSESLPSSQKLCTYHLQVLLFKGNNSPAPAVWACALVVRFDGIHNAFNNTFSPVRLFLCSWVKRACYRGRMRSGVLHRVSVPQGNSIFILFSFSLSLGNLDTQKPLDLLLNRQDIYWVTTLYAALRGSQREYKAFETRRKRTNRGVRIPESMLFNPECNCSRRSDPRGTKEPEDLERTSRGDRSWRVWKDLWGVAKGSGEGEAFPSTAWWGENLVLALPHPLRVNSWPDGPTGSW